MTGKLLTEAGGTLLTEAGGALLTEGAGAPLKAGGRLLNEAGGSLLTEAGGLLLTEAGGTPAGSLRISIASTSGNDPVNGTPYAAGVNLYGDQGAQVGLSLSNSLTPEIQMRPAGSTQQTDPGAIFAFNQNAGHPAEQEWVVATSGKASGNADAAIQFVSQSADNSLPAKLIFEFGGIVAGTMTAAGWQTANPWTALPLVNGWVNHAGNIPMCYRLVTPDVIEIIGILDGLSATNAKFATLPKAPFAQQPACAIVSTAFTGGFVQVDTAGNLTVQAAAATGHIWAVNGRIRLI